MFGKLAKSVFGSSNERYVTGLRKIVQQINDFEPALVDISGIAELSYVRVEGDQVAIGALIRHHELERSDVARAEVPAV